jgi:hypothetical protein
MAAPRNESQEMANEVTDFFGLALRNRIAFVGMIALDDYFSQYFLTPAVLAARCDLASADLAELVAAQLVPEPSYVVEAGTVRSRAFGAMPAPGATAGQFFHPTTAVWVQIARALCSECSTEHAQSALHTRFTRNFGVALAELHANMWPLNDSFAPDGSVVAEGLHRRVELAWSQFLSGTFGLCVAEPITEAHIARKEVLQEKLTALSENGAKPVFSNVELPQLHALIDAYASAAMPFSPIEYPVSSRKRLVDDLRARLRT